MALRSDVTPINVINESIDDSHVVSNSEKISFQADVKFIHNKCRILNEKI